MPNGKRVAKKAVRQYANYVKSKGGQARVVKGTKFDIQPGEKVLHRKSVSTETFGSQIKRAFGSPTVKRRVKVYSVVGKRKREPLM